MPIENVFCVTGIDTDLSMKKIVIETNFNIDSSTANPNNIKLYCVNAEHMELLVPHKIQVSKNNVSLFMETYPSPKDKYYLIVKEGLKDIIGRPVNNVFEKYIYFDYDITSKVEMLLPANGSISKTEDVEIKIAISDENDETKYRFEISSDVAFFNKTTLIFRDNNHEVNNSNTDNLAVIGAIKDGSNLSMLIRFSKNGQYFIRARAEKTHYIVGDWSPITTIELVTTTPLEDQSGYLDDFLLSEEIFKEEFEQLKTLSKTPEATTNQDFYIEFNKKIEFKQDLNSKYTKDGLLYIGKGYFIRRDL